MSFEGFQAGCHGSHPGYRNRMILAILHLCITVTPPIKFQLNRNISLGGDVVLRISWWRPTCIWERNYFSNSESLWHSNDVHQVSAYFGFWLMVWEQMLFEDFQDGHRGGHHGYQNGTILAILNCCVTVMPPIKFWLNPTYSLGGDVVWRISRYSGHFGYWPDFDVVPSP